MREQRWFDENDVQLRRRAASYAKKTEPARTWPDWAYDPVLLTALKTVRAIESAGHHISLSIIYASDFHGVYLSRLQWLWTLQYGDPRNVTMPTRHDFLLEYSRRPYLPPVF